MQKLQNSKGYAKLPEFSPAPGLIVFPEEVCPTNLRLNRSLVRSIIDDNYVHNYVRPLIDTNPITLPCTLARAGKNLELLNDKSVSGEFNSRISIMVQESIVY